MKRRLPVPLILAAVLLGLAALLLSSSEGPRPAKARADVAFPRWFREAETERLLARRTLPPPRVPPAAPGSEEEPPPRDPFLVALPRDPAKPLVVLEANALRHSRLGELFVECVLSRSRSDPFEEARRELGIDLLKDVDRVAFASDGAIVFGFLDRARLDALEADSLVTARGEQGRIYTPRQAGSERMAVGAWRGQLIALGEPAFVEAIFDRLEGREAEAPPVLSEDLTYGEAYGVVPGAALQALLRGSHAELGRRLAETASRIELHADAMRDVAVVARFSGENEDGLRDLGTALGAALAVGRIDAVAQGNDRLGELLEHARVVRAQRGGFSLELALPVEVVERWFEGCGAPR